jgi:hypothetical protein
LLLEVLSHPSRRSQGLRAQLRPRQFLHTNQLPRPGNAFVRLIT